MRTWAAWSALALSGCAQAGASDDAGVSFDAREQIDSPSPGRPDGMTLADARLPVDGAPSAPDAGASPPDAFPPDPPDAREPFAPDAPPCTPTWTNLLANASFDSGPGAPWSESSSGGFPLITNDFSPNLLTPHSPSYGAWLGGFDGAIDDLWQQVTVPASATALRVTGYRVIATADEPDTAYDYLYLRLRNMAGATIETVATYSNVDAVGTWSAFTANASSAHAGQTIQLLVRATNDDDPFVESTHTNFFVDTLRLEALACP